VNRHFLLDFFLISLVFGLIIAVSYFFLGRIGEINIDSVVTRQLAAKESMLFASGVTNEMIDYKKALHSRLRPAIVVVGSSRAMGFRGNFFNRQMVNWGGTVSSLARLEVVINEILRQKHRPEYALILVDVWWMNSKIIGATTANGFASYPNFPDMLTLVKAAEIVSRDYAKVRRAAFARNTDRLGLYAIMKDDGFAADGSWHYSGMVSRPNTRSEQDITEQLRLAAPPAEADEKFSFLREHEGDLALVGRLVSIIKTLKSNSIEPVVILPPLEKSMVNYLSKNSSNDRFKKMADSFAAALIEFHDYSDASSLQPDHINKDCEFVDEFHAGDVINARLLLDMWSRTAQAGLKASIDSSFLKQFIVAKAGFAEGDDRYRHNRPEVNFRGIMCHP